MRNLKRMLSLVMAAAMLMSMMVVSAGASYEDFTDSDEIVNTEAVNAMVNLNVINGYDTGDFQPEGLVTRAEMAKMIAVAKNGGEDPTGDYDCSFTDVAESNWAYKYIAYCVSEGIIAGRSDDIFDPNAYVTGAEAAKMMLVAIGYDAEIEGLVGSDWNNKTLTLANKTANKLFAGSSIGTSLSMSRDYAALLIYNGLNATVVEYYNDYNNAVLSTTGDTLLVTEFAVSVIEGVVEGNEFATLGSTTAKAEGVTVVDGVIYEGTTGADVLGRAVSFYADGDNVIIGAVTLSGKDTVYTTADTIASADLADVLADEGLELCLDGSGNSTPISINYGTYSGIQTNYVVTYSQYTLAGYTNTFIDNNEDGVVDVMISVQPTFGEVSSYSTTTEKMAITAKTVSGTSLTSTSFENIVGYEDVAKLDKVFYYTVAGTTYVELAETVTATVSSVNTSKAQLTADGVTYEKSTMADSAVNFTVATDLGKELTFYLDAAGYVVMVEGATVSSNDYLVVLDTQTTTAEFGSDGYDTYQADVILDDGTRAVVTVASVGGYYYNVETTPSIVDLAEKDIVYYSGTNSASESVTPVIYSYTTDSDGYYELTAAFTYEATTTGLTTGSATVGDTGETKLVYSDTDFIIYNGSDIGVYTGASNVPDVTLSSGDSVLYVYDGTDAVVVFAFGSSTIATDADYAYIFANPVASLNTDGDTIYTYDAIVSGEVTTIVSKTITSITAGLYDVTYSDGYMTANTSAGVTFTMANSNAVAKNGIISDAGSNVYTYSDDTVFVVVDGTDSYEGTVDDIVYGNIDATNYDSTLVVLEEVDSLGTGTGCAAYVYISNP